MAFSCDFSHIDDTSANFDGVFTGGDPGFSGYRYVKLTIDGDGTYQIRSSASGGSTSIFSRVISGLDPGTKYTWEAQLGYDSGGNIIWLDVYDSGSFVTTGGSLNVDPWSWTSSNGEATAVMTRNAYSVINGEMTADNFSHYVWNDLVAKTLEMRQAKGYSWDTANGKYPTASGCRVSAGETLSASKYNGVRYNIGSVLSTGVTDRSPGDIITGNLFTKLTDTLNEIIAGA